MVKTTSKSSNKNVMANSDDSSVKVVAPVDSSTKVVAPVDSSTKVVAPVETKEEVVPSSSKKTKRSKKEEVVMSDSVVPPTESVVPPLNLKSVEKLVPSLVESTSVVVETVVSSPVVSDNSILVLLGELASLDQQEIAIQQQRRVKRRLLEKAIGKVLKANSKATTKKQKRSGNRQPSGFIRPTLISDELATFLGKEIGTELARTAVTNLINSYIKTNNLKDSTNGRQINADEKLSQLLKLTKDDVLTYFNLQRYMKHHFIKKTPVVEEPSQPVA